MVIRTPKGAGHQLTAQHSQIVRGLVRPHPRPEGRRVRARPPTRKGLLKAAIRDDNPVLFVENLQIYKVRGRGARRPGARRRRSARRAVTREGTRPDDRRALVRRRARPARRRAARPSSTASRPRSSTCARCARSTSRRSPRRSRKTNRALVRRGGLADLRRQRRARRAHPAARASTTSTRRSSASAWRRGADAVRKNLEQAALPHEPRGPRRRARDVQGRLRTMAERS